MILYLDTSALVKRYIREEDTDRVNEAWIQVQGVSASIIAYAEALAAFCRKTREGSLSRREYTNVSHCFKGEYARMGCVYLTPQLNQLVEKILETHSLRSFDAIHLASALSMKLVGTEVVFACFDKSLNAAARREGLSLAFG